MQYQDPLKKAWEDVVLKGHPPQHPVREEVLASWHRCKALGLNPFVRPKQLVLPEKEIRKRISVNSRLIEAARPIMQLVAISVRGTGFITTLADKDGYVLEVCGDEDILQMARENYYVPGCQRSECSAGTNAIALCLIEKKPIQLTGAEHYNVHHHAWTCSSAPIFDRQGNLLGAITLSGKSIGKHQHTLALVISAAKAIEGKLVEKELIAEKDKLNRLLTSTLNSIPEAIVVLNEDLVVTHTNDPAVRLLSRGEPITGRPLEEVVDFDVNFLRSFDESTSPCEVSFNFARRNYTCICNAYPITNEEGSTEGKILVLQEKKKVVKLIQRFSGSYAKFQFSDIKGKNPRFLKQVELAKIAARSNSKILLVGESGTGKELFAQAIHNYSFRRDGPFVAISCAAIPRDLIEAELFGYREGAFTGARKGGHTGKFELADKGTLFLDEVNAMPLDLQAKLLRVLQENEITRLGDTKPIPVDVRIIAASNVDLLREVEQRNFREDLYYRLSVVEIFIPPLRERKDDIDLLVDYFLERLSQDLGISRPEISSEVKEIFHAYQWPGNVRELQNCIERALLLSGGKRITKEHLPQRILQKVEGNLRIKDSPPLVPLEENTKELIKRAIELCNGNISLAARTLRISRSTLYRKMKEYGLR